MDRKLEDSARRVEDKAEERRKEETKKKIFQRLDEWEKEEEENATRAIDKKIQVGGSADGLGGRGYPGKG